MFRREIRTASITGLSREIKARRDMVHDAVERSMAGRAEAIDGTPGGRIYQVFASFQGDIGSEEAYYLRG
jgi:hypothetical protein